MTSNEKQRVEISERPIDNADEDFFDAEPRIVNKIYNFIQDVEIAQITIAITGVWGIGKSSVINLLVNKLKANEKNIIITFEPLLEGKFEITDIMSLFYLKLYQKLTNSPIKKVVKNCLESIAILSRFKFTGSGEFDASRLGLAGVKVGGKLEYNWSDHIDALLKLWNKEQPKNFSDQTKILNELLQNEDYRLCIIIDEIDRLPANYIIQFLLFCRVLESFDNLISIIGIDYDQVIKKLIKESVLCLDSYEHAQNYLDKLFQIKFHVHHNKYKKIEYGKKRLKELDHNEVLSEILNSHEYKVQEELEEILSYLSTPRQIKKWQIAVTINYPILKHSPDKMGFLAFLAVTVKHPIITDYLSKHAINFLAVKTFLSILVSNDYEIDFSSDNDVAIDIILASLGFEYGLKKINRNNVEELSENLKKLMTKLDVQSINDVLGRKYIINYLNSPRYLIALFIEGFANEDQVGLYQKFFGDEINDAINAMMPNDSNINMLATDLAEVLQKGYEHIKGIPDVLLLNQIWINKINDDDLFGNPYESIIIFSLRKLPINKVISDSLISMSESYLSRLLLLFNIKNKDGVYNLSDFTLPSENDVNLKGMQDISFNNKPILKFNENTFKQIIQSWIKEADDFFKSNNSQVYSQPKLISVLYRYVQWSLAIQINDCRNKLAIFIINLLKNVDDKDKSYIKNIINKEREKFGSKMMGIKEDPCKTLFDNNKELICLLDVKEESHS